MGRPHSNAPSPNADLVDRWGGRPLLFAIAILNAITGFAVACVIAPLCFGDDAGFYRQYALAAVSGNFDATSFLYPPLTAHFFYPLTWVTPLFAAIIMTLIGFTILMVGVRSETRGHPLVDRVLVTVAVLGFIPVVYELLLGQVTFIIAATIYPVVRRTDAFKNGIPLGIALALAPKPLLIPILLWMVIWRRRALTTTLLVAAALTCLGLALSGVDQYLQWFSLLTRVGQESASGTFSLALKGNFSLWPLDPIKSILAIAICVTVFWTIFRDSSRGFVAAVFMGLLLAPYTGLYAASILLLTVKPALAFAPRATRLFALVANPALGLLHVLAAWSIGGLIVCTFPFRSRRRGRGDPVIRIVPSAEQREEAVISIRPNDADIMDIEYPSAR